MFLLIPLHCVKRIKHNIYLHSTMFLLIPIAREIAPTVPPVFTFHNVSINTYWTSRSVPISDNYLHSTMFLLIQLTPGGAFTTWSNLHSTMFLLIPILHNPLYYKPNSTIFCQPCHLLYLSNTIFNNIMKIFLFLQ